MRRPRVGLALGAGGTKGTAHVGVLKVLSEAGIPIDVIAGASIGAAYGGAYAAGASPKSMAKSVLAASPADVFAFFRHHLRLTPTNLIGRAFFERFHGLSFADLPIAFAAVTSDLFQRRPVIVRSGSLLEAIEASIAVPLMARPVAFRGRYVVDGGFWEQAPVGVVNRMGAERTIQVVLGESIAVPRRFWPFARRFVRALDGPVRRSGPSLAAEALFLLYTVTYVPPPSRADVTIRPDVINISANSPFHLAVAMKRGEEAARAALPLIEDLLT